MILAIESQQKMKREAAAKATVVFACYGLEEFIIKYGLVCLKEGEHMHQMLVCLIH